MPPIRPRSGAALRAPGPIDHLVLAFGSGKGAKPLGGVDIEAVRREFEEKPCPVFAAPRPRFRRCAKTGA